MPSDVIERPGGPAQPHESGPAKPKAGKAEERPVPPPPPTLPTVSSSSTDEFSLSLTTLSPDPLLGAFEAGDAPPVEPRSDAHAEPKPTRAAEFAVPNTPGLAGTVASSSDVMSGIDLAAPPAARVAARDKEEEDEEDGPGRGIGLGTILLWSYASAVTIGLIRVLLTGRKARDLADAEPPVTADASADPGTRASRSHKLVPRPALAPEHVVKLGQTVKIGLLEVTPLRISSGAVMLARNFGAQERKPGETDALKLRLRLRNTSTDTVLAPLDEAFLRDRPGADPDSVIEPPRGNGDDLVIAMYRLALESEWSIVGQDFRDLAPGRELETLIVSEPKVLVRLGRGTGDWTWRVRLRTDINHTDDLGVTFQLKDVKAEPAPKVVPKTRDKSHEVEVK